MLLHLHSYLAADSGRGRIGTTTHEQMEATKVNKMRENTLTKLKVVEQQRDNLEKTKIELRGEITQLERELEQGRRVRCASEHRSEQKRVGLGWVGPSLGLAKARLACAASYATAPQHTGHCAERRAARAGRRLPTLT
jgi:hypothetical protein